MVAVIGLVPWEGDKFRPRGHSDFILSLDNIELFADTAEKIII